MPNQQVLVQMLTDAQHSPNRVVQVYWPVPETQKQVYCLNCVVTHSTGLIGKAPRAGTTSLLPNWELLREVEQEPGKAPDMTPPETIWSYDTGDITLVENIVASAVASPAVIEQQTRTVGVGELRPVGADDRRFSYANAAPPPTNPASNSYADVGAQVTLAGDLSNVALPSVFQSINLIRMTGKLNLYRQNVAGEVFFAEGVLVHAAAQSAVSGEPRQADATEIVLEFLTWDEGTFRFQPSWAPSTATIERRLESLILEGATLIDFLKALQGKGFDEDVLLFTNPKFSDAEVEKILKNGVPADPATQKELLQKAVKGMRAGDLVGTLPKSKWLPMLFNLVNTELLTVGRPALPLKEESFQIDEAALGTAYRTLARFGTGLVDFPFILHFLLLEIARHRKTQHPFSIALIEITPHEPAEVQNHLDALRDAFAENAHEYDNLGHFDSKAINKLAMILPFKTVAAAYLFVDRCLLKMKPRGVLSHAKVAIGIASMPDDGHDLHGIVAAANSAMSQAAAENRNVATYRGIEKEAWEQLRLKGALAFAQENLQEAAKVWTEALACAQKFEKGDARLLETADRLSEVYMAQGKWKLAEPLLKFSVQTMGAGGSVDIALLAKVEQLGKGYFEQGRYDLAEAQMQRSLDLCQYVYGNNSEEMANACYRLAIIYHAQKVFEQSRELYEKALQIKSTLLGAHHPEARRVETSYQSLLKQHKDGSWSAEQLTLS
jgi:tetratricopeptide (TPR) repeat protein